MRRLIAVLSLAATSLFAQEWTDSNDIRVQFADGREQSFPVVTTADVPVIVEFRDLPLALASTRNAKTAIADYQSTFTRFRTDLTAIVNRGASGKTALPAPAFKREYFEALNGVALTVPRDALASLRALTYVKRVHLDKEMKASAIATPVNLSVIRADRVWNDLGSKGKGVVVAIIDTGVDYTHPALGGCLGPSCRVLGGYDFYNNDDDPMDDHFHGTHVAGIVGGNSPDLVGVAPEVSFLAYKVLSAKGSGSESDVIAAVERSIDPNGDGDLSDHADVVNLSLGGFGNADDAVSTAIDNATAAGTVFAIAAGNGGAAHAIDSPGTARLAITVGASDNGDHIASFSSRGPSAKLITIKPDVTAPGVAIRSSMPNGQYAALSGTSMATPHVAGVVALIRALHRDWSPARIKTQLMNSAVPIGEEVMVQGAGRIDALRAASPLLTVDPPSMSLGLDPVGQATWTSSSTLHLTNRTDHAVSYSVSTAAAAGATMTASAPRVALQPGESTDVKVDFSLANGSITPNAGSFSVGGAITLRGSDTEDVIRVPWGAVKAARALVTHDEPLGTAVWFDEAAGIATSAMPISDDGDSEVLLAPGKYDLFMYSLAADPKTQKITDVHVFFLDGQVLDGDTHLLLGKTQASHLVRADARNENGQPLVGSDLTGYGAAGRIILPAGSNVKSIDLPALALRNWHFGEVSDNDTVLLYERYFDTNNSRTYVVPQRPLKGVHADATLSAGGSSLKRADVSLFSGQSLFRDRRILVGSSIISGSSVNTTTLATIDITSAPTYSLPTTAFIGPDTLHGYSFGVSYSAIIDGSLQYVTPPLRIVGDRVVSTSAPATLPSWAWSGSSFAFGSGLIYPAQLFTQSLLNHPGIFTDFAGQLGELRMLERSRTATSEFTLDGSVQARGVGRYPLPLDLTPPGRFTVVALNNTTYLYPTVPRIATVTMSLDSTQSDYFPPVFTALMLFDGAGKLVTRLEPNGGGSLQFAAADFSYGGVNGITKTYAPVRAEATKAWYRLSGPGEWLPVPVTQLVEDQNNGILFRADLSALTNIAAPRQLYDIKLDVADASGNSTSYQLSPAFSVGEEVPPRRRTAR